MTAADRLAQIEARADAATDGPWTWASHRTVDGDEWAVFDPHDWALASNRDGWTPDAEFIAHARTDVPRLVAALRAVLDLHRPLRLYEHEDVCGRTDEEHCDERHVEFEGCEYYCLDHPTDYVMCAECRDVDGDSVDYPCPTARAVEAALGEVAS